jgi:hypothetical protein
MKITLELTSDQVKHFQLLCDRFGYSGVEEVAQNGVEHYRKMSTRELRKKTA